MLSGRCPLSQSQNATICAKWLRVCPQSITNGRFEAGQSGLVGGPTLPLQGMFYYIMEFLRKQV